MKTPRTFGVLVGLVALFSFSLVFRPKRYVLNRPLCDDAFYCFTISRNLALGKGVTIDGSTLTNGFQPLYVFLCVPLFALAGQNKVLAVRMVLVFLWVMYVGCGYLIGQIVRGFVDPDNKHNTSWIGWMGATLYLSAPVVFLMNFSGLETACLMFAYAACWRYYQVTLGDTHRDWVVFGCLLGFLVLTRIDAAFFVVVVSVAQFATNKLPRFSQRFVRFLEVSVPSFLISSPWWFYNVLAFDSLMPSSGKAEQAWEFSFQRFERVFAVLGRELIPWAYMTESHADWTIGVFGRSLALLLVAVAATKFRGDVQRLVASLTSTNKAGRRTLEFAGWVFGAAAILAIWYGLSSWATHMYTRYLLPLSLVAVFATTSAAVFLYQRAPKLVTTIVTLIVAPTLAATILLWHVDRFFVGSEMLTEQMRLIEKYVPPNETVAAGQSGTIGYLRSNVVNLDGKVNSPALGYQSRMWDYLTAIHARWLCDWPSYIHRYLGDAPDKHGWQFKARDGMFDLYRYQPKTAESGNYRRESGTPLKDQ